MSARRQLAIGINEVTKALERNQLRLVLVCKSATPKHMTDYLIPLSISREVPACQVEALSHILSEPLRLKSVLALGFRRCKIKEEDHFLDLVTDIIPMVPPLHVAWLQDKGDPIGTDELLDSDKRGQKRKLEDEITECDITQTEVSEAVSGTLQPLCVKKVIPNPNKKRKKKIKK
ncbi:ribonuclease P protein subunit p38 [Gadus morhua]|uniref:ribonuclease P protein subunit p38 n=1 Tax=Gadus morhua TaxID=8049 RepID=UPI0011B3EC6D|nr:ribonuclease P protein subunit p38 [Gadus morhua]